MIPSLIQPYTLHTVTVESTFEELNLGDVERDAIALDIENHLGIHVCDVTARAWMLVGDVVRTVEKARSVVREAMA